ncbi:MAG: sarcosine oxidase subunit delta, partial [Acidiferrobacterales bacterium]
PQPTTCTDEVWADYVWLSDNEAGVVREWWCHVPSSYWFIAERDTVTDEIVRTYPASQLFKERVRYESKESE